MATSPIAAALHRFETLLQRRPGAGLQDDAPATARWEGGARVIALHGNGQRVLTDMPAEFGGVGNDVTPGWLFRAALASCATTSIVLQAAREGIALGALELRASSRSDTRGLLGMQGADGKPVDPAPGELQLQVRISADDVAPELLRVLVEKALRCSPIPSATQQALPLAVHIDTN
ncbi:OsmC family protein [Ottowia thiooxydans]|uniref:OsmC-like protein n=1 Tax=Ottowia thiooxydans TaxID=219182 RepID=A0ABV2Q3S7_9BURK